MFNPLIWGPHYWFFLNTIALNYPLYPNDVTKKKYYTFIQNFPLFIPDKQISEDFEKLLDLYPVVNYLDNRKSFIKWVVFVHNKINEKLKKDKITLQDFYIQYYNEYKITKKIDNNLQLYYIWKSNIIYFIVITSLLYIIYKYNI